MKHPLLIQGGMGIAVSHWQLARAVSQQGELGVVSGTALSLVLVRRLQLGDPEGHARRALARFPWPAAAARILQHYFVEGGIAPGTPFRLSPLPRVDSGREDLELTVAACFVEVFLAKEGHAGVVGINLLEKIQIPTLPSLYGAMLAGVDYVLMGAGIPRQIPGILDAFAKGQAAEMRIDVTGDLPDNPTLVTFDPSAFFGGPAPELKRPLFLAVVSSAVLALSLAKKSTGKVDGFVVEGPLAGGHNAPPRGGGERDARGQPIYGPRDEVDLEKIRSLGLPFWLAGSYARPERVEAALALGANGVQIGTAFAFCSDSGLAADVRATARHAVQAEGKPLFTDPAASPTGFPFKIVEADGTMGDPAVYADRERICDIGLLREPYRRPDGTLGYRCPAEPVSAYLRKGGCEEDTVGRKCLCNGLAAAAGYAQRRAEGPERALVTAGEDIAHLKRFEPAEGGSYSASDVIAAVRRNQA